MSKSTQETNERSKRRASRNMNMTIGELATKVLIKNWGIAGASFDTALPAAWREDVREATNIDPYDAGTVWLYPKGDITGGPVPLTVEARLALVRYNAIYRADYELPDRVLCRNTGLFVDASEQTMWDADC